MSSSLCEISPHVLRSCAPYCECSASCVRLPPQADGPDLRRGEDALRRGGGGVPAGRRGVDRGGNCASRFEW